MKCSVLVRVKMVTGKLATSHATDGMDEVATVEIFETILIWIVGVGVTVEVIGWRVLLTFLITSVLCDFQYPWHNERERNLHGTPPR